MNFAGFWTLGNKKFRIKISGKNSGRNSLLCWSRVNNYEIIAKTITDTLSRWGLSINCRSQGYDGASNMSSSSRGMQAFVKAASRKALFTHCRAEPRYSAFLWGYTYQRLLRRCLLLVGFIFWTSLQCVFVRIHLSASPKALFAHCRAYCLNLAIVRSSQDTLVKNMIGTLNEVCNFYKISPKQKQQL